MKYAAYDSLSIYGFGDTPEAAVREARDLTRDDGARFEAARISDELAAYIDEHGWHGHHDSFDVVDGQIIDTTNRRRK